MKSALPLVLAAAAIACAGIVPQPDPAHGPAVCEPLRVQTLWPCHTDSECAELASDAELDAEAERINAARAAIARRAAIRM